MGLVDGGSVMERKETIEDYVDAYIRHQGNMRGAGLTFDYLMKEQRIMQNIQQGATLRFKVRSEEFVKLVEREKAKRGVGDRVLPADGFLPEMEAKVEP